MKVIIIATHYDGYMKILEYSCKKNNIDLITIKPYLKKKYEYIDKLYYINEYIKKINDEEIIMVIDAFDTFVCGNNDEIEKKYISSNKKFLISSHDYCKRYMMQIMFNTVFEENMLSNNTNFLNAGMFISKVKYAKQVFNIALNMNIKDDQITLIKIHNNRPDLIQLDTDNILFANLQQCKFIYPMKIYLENNGFIFDENKKRIKHIDNDNYPCVIHGPFNMKLCELIHKIYPEVKECKDTTNYQYFKKIYTNKLFIKYISIIFITLLILIIIIYFFLIYKYKNIKIKK